MKHRVFIEGVAACFKTSSIRMLQGCYDVICGDIADAGIPLADPLLQMWYRMKRQALETKVAIIDRSMFSEGVYHVIANNAEDTYLPQMLANLRAFLPEFNERGLVVVPKKASWPAVVELMHARKNNIDDQQQEAYVAAQVRIWRQVAKVLRWLVIEVDARQPEESISQIAAAAVWLHTDCLMLLASDGPLIGKSPHWYDAGIPLKMRHEQHCKKGEKTELLFDKTIGIPLGYLGQILARSSTSKNLGTIRTGVIDATFTGQLSAIFVADEDLTLCKGQHVAQLVVLPKHDFRGLQVDDESILPIVGRGKSGWGSTSEPHPRSSSRQRTIPELFARM